MKLDRLALRNFRNYERLESSFSPGVNLIVGDNAQGKTNLLEAIDDILVYAGTLADDNSSIIVSHDGSRVLYDKDNPRTEVYISQYE